jgi:hypothetical protein
MMKLRRLAVGVLAAIAVMGAATAVRATTFHYHAHGRMSTAEPSRTKGVFRLSSQRDTEKDRVKEALFAEAKKLDTTKDDQGNPPDYHLWLVKQDGAESDFGYMFLNRGGNGRFRFDSKRDLFPEGVTTLTAFGGGKIQVRTGDTVVLEGTVPAFAGPGDEPSPGADTRIFGKSRLTPTAEDSRARGEIQALFHSNSRRAHEAVTVRCQGLSGDLSPYSVVAIAADTTVTELFTGLLTRNRRGDIRATLDTLHGHTIPGGGILGLSEQTIEVRDKDGNAVLTGAFPDVTID